MQCLFIPSSRRPASRQDMSCESQRQRNDRHRFLTQQPERENRSGFFSESEWKMGLQENED